MHAGTGNYRIETERLVLRAYDADDFPELLALFAHPETFRFSERGPMSSDEAWGRLLRHIGHWQVMGYGLFAVEEKPGGGFVGEAGFADFRRQLDPRFDEKPEATWSIAPSARGQGYATEAAAAALAWMEGRFAASRTVCLIHAQNQASLRVAEKLGYEPFAERIYKGYPAILHERDGAAD